MKKACAGNSRKIHCLTAPSLCFGAVLERFGCASEGVVNVFRDSLGNVLGPIFALKNLDFKRLDSAQKLAFGMRASRARPASSPAARSQTGIRPSSKKPDCGSS